MDVSELELTLSHIENASSRLSLFSGTPDQQRATYHKLSKLIFPDRVPTPIRARAEEAFKKLNELYNSLSSSSSHASSTTQTQPQSQHHVHTFGSYTIKRAFEKGDICNLYVVDHEGVDAVLKIAREGVDDSLVKVEADALTDLGTSNPKSDPNYSRYLPTLLASIKHAGARGNVISLESPYYHPLSFITSQYPNGLDFRHAIWMMNRMLSLLGYIHLRGYVHGAILPEHILYNPTNHGLKLVDWCCSVSSTSTRHIPLIVATRAQFYPLEVSSKVFSPSTDIYMLAYCIRNAFPDIPKRFRPYFDYCLLASYRSRPSNAWDLQDQWKKLAEIEYGAPKFIPLTVPVH